MMPLSHVHVSTQVAGRKNSLLVFGSVLPDISFSSDSAILRAELHDSPMKFMNFVKENFPELSELAVGVRLHSGIDKGADYYSDNKEAGFALRDAEQIWEEVAAMLGSPKDERSLTLGHNFIEAGVDLNLAQSRPELEGIYLDALAEIDVQAISLCLSKYVSKEQDQVTKLLNSFLEMAKGVGLPSKMAEFIFRPLINARMGAKAKDEDILNLIKKSVAITAPNYERYLQAAIDNMKRDFAGI
jgi:hypothetical protein